MVALLENAPQISVVNNAIATPFRYEQSTTKISGCLYDAEGNLVQLSQRTSGVGGDRIVNADPEKLDYSGSYVEFPGESVYLGHLMGHYGHFITETISSFWALSSLKFERVVFHPFIFGGAIRPFMKPFFDAFNITEDKIVTIRDYSRFESIAIPERLFKLNHSVYPQYAECARKVASFVTEGALDKSAKKLFLSRSRLATSLRAIGNDQEVDALVAELGFEVVHPEEMSITDQISAYAKCDVMVGFSGSALHNCIFMDPKSLLIEIGDPRSPDLPLATQRLCNLSVGVNASHIKYRSAVGQDKNCIDLAYLREAIQNLL